MVHRILSVRRHCGESRAVSCSIAVTAIVRKHPNVARIILPWTEERALSCAMVGAVLVSNRSSKLPGFPILIFRLDSPFIGADLPATF